MPAILGFSLAALDTACIVLSGAALVVGRLFIWRRRVRAHMWSMLTASGFALAFLVLYVVRTRLAGITHFGHGGAPRDIYLAILATHTIAATAVAPLAVVTLYRALRGRREAHRRIARWTFPVWLYTAVTGWLIYYLLYHL